MPRIAGTPMGYGIPKKVEPPSHTIYADGSYSNELSTVESKEVAPVSKRDRVKKNMVLRFGTGPHVLSVVAHHITERGVFCRPSLHEEVDLSRCIFYSWDEIETQETGGL